MIVFTIGSGAGLVTDLGLFSLLVLLGAPPFLSSLVATSAAVSVVYVLVTRFAFKVRPSWRTYAAFVAWYGTSALIVSAVIGILSDGEEWRAFLVKACTVPVTFVTNYLFGRWLFSGGAERLLSRRRADAVLRAVRARPSEDAVTRILQRVPFKKWRWIWAAVATAAFAVLVLPMNVAISFSAPADSHAQLLAHLLQIAFLVVLLIFLVFALRLAQAVRIRSLRHRRWLLASVAYLGVNVVLLAAIYPGYWVWDEFYTLRAVKQWSTFAWQGYITNVFYSFGMFTIPSPMGILLIQLVVVALVAGYVVSNLQMRLQRPWLALALGLPLLSFPVLLNNLYPLRLTVYAFLLLLLLARIPVMLEARKRAVAPRWGSFLGATVLIGVLMFWRTEGIYLVVMVPVVAYLTGVLRPPRAARRRAVGAALAAVSAIGLLGYITVKPSDPGYQLTAFINPLSTMIQDDLHSPSMKSDLAGLSGVLDLGILRAYPDFQETPSFREGVVRSGFQQHLSGFRWAFVDLVAHNPGPFLENRWDAFVSANSMEPTWLPQVLPKGVYQQDVNILAALPEVESTNFAMRPIAPSVKYPVERTLLLWSADQRVTPVGSLVWNVVPILAGLLILAVWATVRRRWTTLALIGILLTNVVLVFLSEPASYFMYYFPVYLAGGVLLTTAIVTAVDQRWRNRILGSARSDEQSTPVILAQREPAREDEVVLV